ncbi:MAG TPA: ATP-binding cassette domain-containing protein [Roseiflexaceae bacterium]|nr:ATP-binding cassette domain-containing protein [Roseiflexaceae bacterium]
MFGNWFHRTAKTNGASNGHYRNGNEHLIDMRQIVKTYQSTAGSFTALKGVDLQIDRGEFVAIIGKSGSGKSTLINMITGIDRPTSGEVLVGDAAVHLLSEGQMAVWRGRNLGVIFQFFQLLPTLTIVENVMLPMDFCNMYEPHERHARAMRLLEQVEMAHQANKLPSAVSGGQQQRVAIARALANDPPILVADEPTGNLDSKTANAVFQLFENLVAQGKTVLMVTHDSDLAKRVSRAVIVADGEIVNEYVAKALAALSVDQLGWVTGRLEARVFAPGAPIITQGEVADQFYIITKGQVEILLHHPGGQDIAVTTLSAGQYFGEIGLLRGGVRTATVRAAGEDSVEVVALDREEFNSLIADSEAMKTAIDRVADQRFVENSAAREVNHA